jgi:hypothetical protein
MERSKLQVCLRYANSLNKAHLRPWANADGTFAHLPQEDVPRLSQSNSTTIVPTVCIRELGFDLKSRKRKTCVRRGLTLLTTDGRHHGLFSRGIQTQRRAHRHGVFEAGARLAQSNQKETNLCALRETGTENVAPAATGSLKAFVVTLQLVGEDELFNSHDFFVQLAHAKRMVCRQRLLLF